jgi:Zn-dependent protease with chaperone function
MGVFVFLPLVLPLSAWPIARLAQRRLHPRTATRLLTAVGIVLAVSSTLCLALIMVVGTAQLPGNPLPDGWSDPEVREAVPYDEVAGKVAIPALIVVTVAWARTLWRHSRIRRQAERALTGLPSSQIAVLPDETPYAYALPSRDRGRIVVSTGMLACLDTQEREALFAHERTHLTAHHHRFLLAAQLAARANPFLRPLKTAIAFSAERWADEAAAHTVGDRRLMARTVGKAALVSRPAVTQSFAGFAAPGPVPRRVQALLDPAPDTRTWPPAYTAVGLALWMAAAGTAASALSSANATVALVSVLHAATPL